jgi:hypothetical protein
LMRRIERGARRQERPTRSARYSVWTGIRPMRQTQRSRLGRTCPM